MKSVPWRSGTTLAVAFLFVGCGGTSPGSKDAASERGRADSAREAGNAGRDLSVDRGLADGQVDLRNDVTIPAEAGRDSAVDVTVATPDSPPGESDGGMEAGVDAETSACPAGYHDGGDGVCVPTGTCSPGLHDYGTGVCVKTGCAAGYHNGGDGTCVATGLCSTGYRNGGNGTCVTDGTCLMGYHDDGSGMCIQTVCPSGYHDGGDGTCVATGTCVSGYHDGGNGGCTPLGICLLGYHDSGTGTCVAAGSCANGYHNGGNGTCVAAGSCATGYHIGGSDTCVAIGTCSLGYHDRGDGTCVLNNDGSSGAGGGGGGTGGSGGAGGGGVVGAGGSNGSVVDAAVDATVDIDMVDVTTDVAVDIASDSTDETAVDSIDDDGPIGEPIDAEMPETGEASDGADTDSPSDGSGGAVCSVPEDCEGVDTACTFRTCIANICGIAPRAEGPAPDAFQPIGNCKNIVCDSLGAEILVDDSANSSDGNECTVDSCTAGTLEHPSSPTHTPVAPRTACNGGLNVCDSSGMCVPCSDASECPVYGECKVPKCNSGTCSSDFEAPEIPCTGGSCDGAGNCQPIH